MWSDGKHLFVKLASNKQLYQIDGYINEDDPVLSSYIK